MIMREVRREKLAKLTQSQWIELWKDTRDETQRKTYLYHRCAPDLELFALYYFEHYARHKFNSFHTDLFKSSGYGERKVRRVRAAPRGYAKSTFAALIKPIHDLCYGLENFILIFSNTEAQSVAKLKDIRTELLTNDKLIRDYGIRFPRKNVAETAFEVFARDHACMFMALVFAGQEAAGPLPGGDRLLAGATGGGQHDVARQVLGLGTEAVEEPGAHARAAFDN